MAGWGTGSIQNEDAQKFFGGLNCLQIDDLTPILARAADQSDYLEAAESSIAVAAAEAVAALVAAAKAGDAKKKAPSAIAPKELAAWVEKENEAGVSPELVDLARRAVERVRTNSELKDLWLEAEGLNEWSASLRDLEKRLAG
jgi:hypothetical protein